MPSGWALAQRSGRDHAEREAQALGPKFDDERRKG